ncbi:MAG: CRISPR-associated helicase Cas3' [Chloroflexi bacterium]|nr:CRISPR-associated helicase Cas3' [Chloroflexota bacterium]
MDEDAYRAFFRDLNAVDPYEYQVDLARRLMAGQNVVLRAPTGAGKTAAVLTPFLFDGWAPKPRRLIYVLPLRTLAQSIHHTAQEELKKRSLPEDLATLQTGEQPDDPFLDRGRVIVTTYDQLLSGMLASPYGLSARMHNINAAAVAGALVVFDEFHLMEPNRAFLTAAAGLALFGPLVQSVWMTATATEPLVTLLSDAVGCNEAKLSREELLALPSVAETWRHLVYESEPLSASFVLRHSGRIIVLANTVPRAQALYKEIVRGLKDAERDVPVFLLHSQFFRVHRQEKERRLREFFGRGASGPAILVATQVIEAGLDLTCDHLFTEVCPINALVQRAGRCARFKGQSGTVHVHPLPDAHGAWLPYGNRRQPEPALGRTVNLLRSLPGGPVRLTPDVAAAWVQQVHGEDDQQALRSGWRPRRDDILQRISATVVWPSPQGVADLIREPDTDHVRVVVAWPENLPERPGQRDAVAVSRWQLWKTVEERGGQAGWYWETDAEPGWQPLTLDALPRSFILCLHPDVARYTDKVGLELGQAGVEQSPDRQEPRRPGHSPLHAETWVHHALAVAEEARGRAELDGVEGWLQGRLAQGFDLTPWEVLAAVRCTALLHDLGKLQKEWQVWAEAAQRAKRSDYQHATPLAHTDFDPDSSEHRRLERELRDQRNLRRPPHAAAGAYLAASLWPTLLASVRPTVRRILTSACSGAILAHHGGWLPNAPDLGLQPLAPGWERCIQEATGLSAIGPRVHSLYDPRNRRALLEQMLQATMGPDQMLRWWPLVAYLTRTLRLADQRATAEGGES